MATLYWIGGTGNFSDGTHWSLTSGGAAVNATPIYTDDVIFNSASSASSYVVTFTQVSYAYNWTINAPASGTLTLAGASAAYVCNNLTIAATGVSSTQTVGFTITSTSVVNGSPTLASSSITTITTNNNSGFATCPIRFNLGSNNMAQLGSDLTMGDITMVTNQLATNGYNITATNWGFDANWRSSTNPRIYFSNSNLNVSGNISFVSVANGDPGSNILYTDSNAPAFSYDNQVWDNIMLSQSGPPGNYTYTALLMTTNLTQYQNLKNSISSITYFGQEITRFSGAGWSNSNVSGYGGQVDLTSGLVQFVQDYGFSNPFYQIAITLQFPTFVNSAGGQRKLTLAGGGQFSITLSGVGSQFSGYSWGFSGDTIYIPKVTFSSSAPSSGTTAHTLQYNSGQFKAVYTGFTCKTFQLDGPNADGYSAMSLAGINIKIKKEFIVTGSYYRRMFIRGIIQGSTAGGQYDYSSTGYLQFTGGSTYTCTVSDADFSDITFKGDNITTITNTRVGNGGNNVINNNFAFTTPLTLYWSGTTGGTITPNTSNWALVDGQAPSGFPPLIHDTLKFTDNALNSGATLTIGTATWAIPTLDFSSRTLPVTLAMGSSDVYFYGGLKLNSSVTMTASAGIAYFCGPASNITSNSATFTKQLAVWSTGTVKFIDNFTSNVSYIETDAINLLKGILDYSGVTVNTRTFSSSVTPAALTGFNRTLLSSSSSVMNITTTVSSVQAFNNVVASQFSNGGNIPKIYLTGNTSNASRYVTNYNSVQPEFCDPIDVYIVGGTNSSTRLQGMFGVVDNTSNPNGPQQISPDTRVYIRNGLKLLDNTFIGSSMYYHPLGSTTCSVITNWVAGQGAVGTRGSNIGGMYIGNVNLYNAYGSSGTVSVSGGGTLGDIMITAASFSITGTYTSGNFESQFGSSVPRTVTFTNAILNATNRTFPFFFQGTNVSVVYDSNSKIVITGPASGAPYNIGNNVPNCKAPPIEIKADASYVRSSAGVYSSLTIAAGQTLEIQGFYTITVDKWITNGTRANPVNIKGYTSTATISKTGGYVTFTGVNFTSIAATGTAKFLAYQSTATSTTGITVSIQKQPAVSSYLGLC